MWTQESPPQSKLLLALPPRSFCWLPALRALKLWGHHLQGVYLRWWWSVYHTRRGRLRAWDTGPVQRAGLWLSFCRLVCTDTNPWMNSSFNATPLQPTLYQKQFKENQISRHICTQEDEDTVYSEIWVINTKIHPSWFNSLGLIKGLKPVFNGRSWSWDSIMFREEEWMLFVSTGAVTEQSVISVECTWNHFSSNICVLTCTCGVLQRLQ